MTLGGFLIVMPNGQNAAKRCTSKDVMHLNLSRQEEEEVRANADTELLCIANTSWQGEQEMVAQLKLLAHS